MKYVCPLLLILCFCSAQAEAPWGVLDDAVDDHTYGVDKLLAGQPIRYAVSEDITPQEEQIFKANFYQWPRQTLRLIKQQKREKEFEEILPYLQQNLQVQKINEKESYDVRLYIEPNEIQNSMGGNITGFYQHGPRKIAVISKYRDNLKRITLHEIGHFYGMSDQYYAAHFNTSIPYSNNGLRDSVMRNSDHLTCDDADGFINLITLRLSQQGRPTRLAQRSWESLCKDSPETYQNSQTLYKAEPETELNFNAFPLFQMTDHERYIGRNKEQQITSIFSPYAIADLCPQDRSQLSSRNFAYNPWQHALEIWCNTGTREKEPDWVFPLEFGDDWKVHAYHPLKHGKMYQSISVFFHNHKLERVELFQQDNSSWPAQYCILSRDLVHNVYTLTWAYGIPIGEGSYRQQTVGYSVLGNSLRNNLTALSKFPLQQRQWFLKIEQELNVQLRYVQSFYKNFYRPILEQPQRQQAQQQVARQLKLR